MILDLEDEKMLRYHRPTPEAYASLKRRLEQPSLRDIGSEESDHGRDRRRGRRVREAMDDGCARRRVLDQRPLVPVRGQVSRDWPAAPGSGHGGQEQRAVGQD